MKNKDKVVWITGASSGIGKATAKLLLEYGYVVYASAKKKEKIMDLKRLGAHIMLTDINKDGDIKSGLAEIIANEGRIDILINSARFELMEAINGTPISEAKSHLDSSVFGLARLSQLVLPYMRRQKSGKIVMMHSFLNKRNGRLSDWYNASRFALKALSSSIRKEVLPFGIDIMLIEPDDVKLDLSTIAAENLNKISEGKSYSKLVEQFWHHQSRPSQKMLSQG